MGSSEEVMTAFREGEKIRALEADLEKASNKEGISKHALPDITKTFTDYLKLAVKYHKSPKQIKKVAEMYVEALSKFKNNSDSR